MLLHACGDFPGASRPSRGVSRSLQGPPGAFGASRAIEAAPGLQGPALNEKCARRVPAKPRTWARLKFHAGWSGWTRPPTMAGGAGWPIKGSEPDLPKGKVLWGALLLALRLYRYHYQDTKVAALT